MGFSQFEENSPGVWNQPWTDASDTTPLNFVQDSVRSLRLDQITGSTDDTSDVIMQFWLGYNGTVGTLLGSVTIPALAGFDPTIPPVDVLAVLFPRLAELVLPPNWCVFANPTATLTTAKSAYINALGGLF